MDADNVKTIELLPEFHSNQELGEFWDTHSLAEYWDQTEPAELDFDPAMPKRCVTLDFTDSCATTCSLSTTAPKASAR